MRPYFVDGAPRHKQLVNPSIGKFFGYVDLGNGQQVKVVAMSLPVQEKLVIGVLGFGVAEFDGTHIRPLDAYAALNLTPDLECNVADLINDQFGHTGKRYGDYPDVKENHDGQKDTEGCANQG